MKRREFHAASATVAAAPMLLGMTQKTAPKTPSIGIDGWKYECHHNWGTLPGELEWETTHGCAVDSQGLIYITHRGEKKKEIDTVVVFDDSGKYVRSFGKQWYGGGHGIDIRKEGNEEFIYLCHMTNNGPVVKTNLKGEVVWSKGRPKVKEYANTKAAYKPTNVAFAPDGGFFVADGYGSAYIQKLDKDGNLLLTFGGGGTDAGKFRTPHGLWVDNRNPDKPLLVVCDRANARLQSFDLNGKFVSMTDKRAVFFPAHIDILGDVMLVSDLHACMSLFDKSMKPIVHLADDDAWRARVVASLSKDKGPALRAKPGDCPAGKFIHPHDACFDAKGNIIVAEWVEGGRITFLKKV
jgi:hypothetical protein